MMRTTVVAAMAAAITITVAANTANAGSIRGGNGLTTIWVTIEAYPGEGLWEACRRVYQRDVFKVRGGPDIGLVRCEIDHSRING